MLAGPLDDIDDVFEKDIGDVDLVHGLSGGNEVLGGPDSVSGRLVEQGDTPGPVNLWEGPQRWLKPW